ncbi:MAG: YcgL domain-containing protein [Thermodesulfobacteriota bacterium]
MKVNIYKGRKTPSPRERLYVLVRAGYDINNLPLTVKEQTGDLIFKKTIDLKPGEKRIAIDSNETIDNIKKNGYHLQRTKTYFYGSDQSSGQGLWAASSPGFSDDVSTK